MTDQSSGPSTRCPWCSAPLPEPNVDTCPSCGAHLITQPGVEGEIRGVTALDPEAILRARSDAGRSRNRLLSFITGDVPADSREQVNPDSFAPPPEEVKREIARMEMEADLADIAAEAVAMKAETLAERGIPLSELDAQAEALNDSIEAIDPADDEQQSVAAADTSPETWELQEQDAAAVHLAEEGRYIEHAPESLFEPVTGTGADAPKDAEAAQDTAGDRPAAPPPPPA